MTAVGVQEAGEGAAPAPFLSSVRTAVADGPKSRQLLLTLMADYWMDPNARVPSAALVQLLADFGITSTGARTILNRLAREERLVMTREGRRTFYALSERARRRVVEGLKRIEGFGGAGEQGGQWTCVAFSIPEDVRQNRHKLRSGLQWLGFAPLYDGLWVCPRPVADQASRVVKSLGITAATVFEGALTGIGSAYGRPTDAWDLEVIEAAYRDFVAQLEAVVPLVEAGRFDDREALVWRTELMNVWRAFPKLDPDLPESMLPSGWLRPRARLLFDRLYGGLAEPAQRHVRHVVSSHSPDSAPWARAHGTDLEWGAGLMVRGAAESVGLNAHS